MELLATTYPRNDKGWIEYPRDTTLRQSMLSPEIAQELSKHPAKMNMHLCMEVILYNTKAEDVILDPFGGIGTTLVAATLGRHVILCELEPVYVQIAQKTIDYYQANKPDLGNMVVIQGDNRRILPIPCDHIITSPPYGNDLYKEEGQAVDESIQESVTTYAANNMNFGRFNEFYYNQQMKQLYKKMADSLNPGGTITITHRDRQKGTKRVMYAKEIMQTLTGLGLELKFWDKWKAPGSFQSRINEAKGATVILDEDIICFRKPQ